jgi:single-stranded-DNA-specific exonuclease
LALSICLGDRSGEIIDQIYEIITKYNNLIKKTSSHLFAEKWRFYDDRETIFINGEGVIEPKNVDSFIIFLEKSISFADRLICLRILDSEECYRLIITKPKFSNFDLTNIKEKIKKKLGEKEEIEKENIKIIDKDKLEIKISTSNLEDFLSNIKKIIINEKVS